MARIGSIFLAGVLLLLPLAVTVAVVAWVTSLLATYVGPNSWFGRLLVSVGLSVNDDVVAPYAVGLLLVLGLIFLLGILVEHGVGAWLGSAFDRLIRRIPIVSNIYDLSSRFTSMVDRRVRAM